ncbi:ribosomal protein S6 modification protein [Pseudidiomarina salinarum]|uniref:Ribosomal protein S6 modification protein n=1 Tax=Pseudidiomarina salinarum TaxID=435908 RepID=A0A094JFH2_9GAMM|nr:ATP-dependent zinc protease [Pseudidiomarina salinarum]KFZ31296.1 ribosomal protein S6 modification protein [Pseudidiomarina salinarum]RUO70953.1 ATP-dependent zinc protease [Pseudidiomarina salinarum]
MQTLGWREWGALPDLGIPALKMKVDTGARTSCLHAFRLEPFDKDGEDWLRIWLHPEQDSDREQICEARIHDQRPVTDSGGHTELRYVIKSTLRLGTFSQPIELTLTNRDTMKFRMLLGRQAMRGHFLVDPDASYLIGKPGAPS